MSNVKRFCNVEGCRKPIKGTCPRCAMHEKRRQRYGERNMDNPPTRKLLMDEESVRRRIQARIKRLSAPSYPS